MTNPKTRYQEALSAFTVPGNRWSGVLALTYWATAIGLSPEAVLNDAHAAGVLDRDGDIRRGMASAELKIVSLNAKRPMPSRTPFLAAAAAKPRNETPASISGRVSELIDVGKDVRTLEALRVLSPTAICPDRDPLARRVQCEMQLLAYFAPTEIIHVFRPDRPSVGERGKNLRSLGPWLTDPSGTHPDLVGEIVRPNPFTGSQGTTKDGKASYIAQDCLAAYRHMVFEFDNLALDDQCRFWAGFVRKSTLPLVSLVYSGNKSIHGIVRVDASDVGTWKSYRERILRLFASDRDKRRQLDPQALHPLTGTRLAGVCRRSTGKLQELLWVDDVAALRS